MSYTFGGNTGDDITATGTTALGSDNTSCLVAGWWYPTTLTATRGYWSCGNAFGAEVDTTTSEIRLRTDNTTDGQWVTSGAGITTDKWWFLAFLNASENTTVPGAWRVWVGDENTEPVMITPSVAVSRSGNYIGSATLYVGNKGTGTLAFQGDIGWVVFATTSTVGINGPFKIGTSGAISSTEDRLVYERWVAPLWRGRPNALEATPVAMTSAVSVVHFALDQLGAPVSQWSSSTSPGNPLTPTINTAVWSENQPPVRLPRDWIFRGRC